MLIFYTVLEQPYTQELSAHLCSAFLSFHPELFLLTQLCSQFLVRWLPSLLKIPSLSCFFDSLFAVFSVVSCSGSAASLR